ncbi:MAG: hypothetical protein Q9166_002295 [cf. Caloplaca sp. 2 TL-2023]
MNIRVHQDTAQGPQTGLGLDAIPSTYAIQTGCPSTHNTMSSTRSTSSLNPSKSCDQWVVVDGLPSRGRALSSPTAGTHSRAPGRCLTWNALPDIEPPKLHEIYEVPRRLIFKADISDHPSCLGTLLDFFDNRKLSYDTSINQRVLVFGAAVSRWRPLATSAVDENLLKKHDGYELSEANVQQIEDDDQTTDTTMSSPSLSAVTPPQQNQDDDAFTRNIQLASYYEEINKINESNALLASNNIFPPHSVRLPPPVDLDYPPIVTTGFTGSQHGPYEFINPSCDSVNAFNVNMEEEELLHPEAISSAVAMLNPPEVADHVPTPLAAAEVIDNSLTASIVSTSNFATATPSAVAKVIDQSVPTITETFSSLDTASSPLTEDQMPRGNQAPSRPSPLSHSHPVPSFSPRRLTEQEMHTDQATSLTVEDVGALMYSSESGDSNAHICAQRPVTPSTPVPRSIESGKYDDRATMIVDIDNDGPRPCVCSGSLTPVPRLWQTKKHVDPIRDTPDIDNDDDPAAEDLSDRPKSTAQTTDQAHPVSDLSLTGAKLPIEQIPNRSKDVTDIAAANIVNILNNTVPATNIGTATNNAATEKAGTQKGTPRPAKDLNTFLTSLIPSAPTSPTHQSKTINLDDESEDPFENFNSGSEQEDEADVDFPGGSASPSVHSISPEPQRTPDSSDEKAARRGEILAPKALPRKQNPRRDQFGNWPVANMARPKGAPRAAATPVKRAMGYSFEYGDPIDGSSTAWPLTTESSKAADRGVAVSGINAHTSAGYEHNTPSPLSFGVKKDYVDVPVTASAAKPRPGSGRPDGFVSRPVPSIGSGVLPRGGIGRVGSRDGKGGKRLWDQMLEAEEEAEREGKRLKEVEEQVRVLKKMRGVVSTRTGLSQEARDVDVAGVKNGLNGGNEGVEEGGEEEEEKGQMRNGAEWTLVVERDSEGRKVCKWEIT